MKIFTAFVEALLVFALFVLVAAPFFVMNMLNANTLNTAPIAQVTQQK